MSQIYFELNWNWGEQRLISSSFLSGCFSEYFVYLLLLVTQYINISFKLVEIFEPGKLWIYYLYIINVINYINYINVIN